MQPNEVEAVLAHEIGHIVDRTILGNRQGHGIGYFITSLVAQVVLGILASTIVCWFSRQREFRADAAGAKSGKLAWLFSTHPSLEDRIAALRLLS